MNHYINDINDKTERHSESYLEITVVSNNKIKIICNYRIQQKLFFFFIISCTELRFCGSFPFFIFPEFTTKLRLALILIAFKLKSGIKMK